MKDLNIIKRIKVFSLLAFIFPLIAINLCWIIYYYIGTLKTYRDIPWNNKETTSNFKDYHSAKKSFINCPKYKYNIFLKLNNGKLVKFDKKSVPQSNQINNVESSKILKINEFVFKHSDEKNNRCIKNHTIANFIITSFNLEKSIIILRKANDAGFSIIENPYINGEVSISRTARFFPVNYIFKSMIPLSAVFLFIYWLNNLYFFSWFKKNKKAIKFNKKFFYFGLLSCVFLILHSIFLGVSYDSQLFKSFRKIVIISFILFEVLSQVYLTLNILKFSEDLKNYLRINVLKIKVGFIVIIILTTIISLYILAFEDPSSNFKNILEWNYFSVLLIYYFLSNILWKVKKP